MVTQITWNCQRIYQKHKAKHIFNGMYCIVFQAQLQIFTHSECHSESLGLQILSVIRRCEPSVTPYPSGLLHWHWGSHIIAPVSVKQPWRIWVNKPHRRIIGQGGHFKNAYELVNRELLNFQHCIKIISFSVWVRYFVWNFKGYPLKFHTKYPTHALKDV